MYEYFDIKHIYVYFYIKHIYEYFDIKHIYEYFDIKHVYEYFDIKHIYVYFDIKLYICTTSCVYLLWNLIQLNSERQAIMTDARQHVPLLITIWHISNYITMVPLDNNIISHYYDSVGIRVYIDNLEYRYIEHKYCLLYGNGLGIKQDLNKRYIDIYKFVCI